MTDNLSPAKIRERASRPNTLVAFSTEEALIVADAIEIADASAWAHVEGETVGAFARRLDCGWIHLGPHDAGLDRSLAYLTARGLIERHPEQPWVRIKEASA